jgi:hypothetical protein
MFFLFRILFESGHNFAKIIEISPWAMEAHPGPVEVILGQWVSSLGRGRLTLKCCMLICAVNAHPGAFLAQPGAIEAHPGPLEVYLLAVKAHPRALKTHPGALEAHSGAMESHPGAM